MAHSMNTFRSIFGSKRAGKAAFWAVIPRFGGGITQVYERSIQENAYNVKAEFSKTAIDRIFKNAKNAQKSPFE
jgi:hypothetical protein